MQRIRESMVRFGMMASLALALMATVVAPQMASAAAFYHINTSAYTTNTRCFVKDGENQCERKFDAAYQMLQVTGTRFTKLAPVVVQVYGFDVIPTEMVSVVTDKNGSFVFKSQQTELCQAGIPVSVQALDVATGQWSNVATAMACVS